MFGHVMVIPNLMGIASLGIRAREMGRYIVGLEVRQQLLRPFSRLIKRSLDIAATIAASPVIFGLVGVFAMLIRLEGRGPIFYSNERVGYKGKKFKAWKRRSMMPNGGEVLQKYLEKTPKRYCNGMPPRS